MIHLHLRAKWSGPGSSHLKKKFIKLNFEVFYTLKSTDNKKDVMILVGSIIFLNVSKNSLSINNLLIIENL